MNEVVTTYRGAISVTGGGVGELASDRAEQHVSHFSSKPPKTWSNQTSLDCNINSRDTFKNIFCYSTTGTDHIRVFVAKLIQFSFISKAGKMQSPFFKIIHRNEWIRKWIS